MRKMTAGLGGNNKMVFSGDLNAAHPGEYPLQAGSLGIVIQGAMPSWAWVPSQLSQTVVAPALGMNSQPGISSFSSIL